MHSHGDKNNVYTSTASIIHSEFVNNTVTGPRRFFNGISIGSSLIFLDAVVKTTSTNKICHNRANLAIIYIPYYHHAVAENFTKNLFNDNSAGFEVFVSSSCQPGLVLFLSLTSTRIHCISCSANCHQDLIGIVVAAFIAGIALVIFVLARSRHDCCHWYSQWNTFLCSHCSSKCRHVLFAIQVSKFCLSVHISWLNLDIGFDVCFSTSALFEVADIYQALI